MAGASKQKQKLLRMEQIFKTQTDENNVITGNELIEILEKEGIKAERKTIYDDIATLCDSGVTIETVKKGHSNAYFYLNREDFSAEELFILASAVASCRFLTTKKSNELIAKMQRITNRFTAAQLGRQIHVAQRSRNKSVNETIYYSINTIQNAIARKRKITFKYYTYNSQKKRQLKHGGESYLVSPNELVWENDNYYLTCVCHNHGQVCRYRVDRMADVVMTDSKIAPFTDSEKQELENNKSLYSMYGGEKREIRIQFDNSLMDVVIDRFGENVECAKAGTDNAFVIRCEVQISPPFWGWLFQFGTKAMILEPFDVVREARLRLSEMVDKY
ncbi:MAG: WYL domain-containing protein [Ruminococcus sp.]|nr:WYL domain-containing protein [Ruminococcus sp.]